MSVDGSGASAPAAGAAAGDGAQRDTPDFRALFGSVEAYLAAVVRSSGDALIGLAPDGTIRSWNPAAEWLFGYTPEEAIGQPITLLGPSGEHAAQLAMLARARAGETVRIETARVAKGGRPVDVHLTVAPILDATGAVAGFAGTLADVTEHRRSEAALRASQARLAGVIGSATDAIITTDAEQRIVLTNGAAERVFDYRAQELVGQPLDLLIPERFRTRHRSHVEHFGRTGTSTRAMGAPGTLSHLSLAGRRRDGSEFPIEASISQVVTEEGRYYTVILRDVTERAAAEAERERLFAAERAARAEAEAARQRVAFLAEASARLAGSLDVEATLRTVAELAVPSLADWCFVEVREDDGSIRPAAIVHSDPAKVALARDSLRRYPIDPEAPFGTGHVLRTGQPELAPDITDEVLASVAQDAEHLAILREVGFRSSLSVPLLGPDGRPSAVLSLVSTESGRRFGPADLAMAEEVARRAGAALASARLYAAEQAALRRATALQRVTAALSGALTVEQAGAVVVEQSVSVLNAEGGAVCRLTDDGSTFELVGAVGYPDGVMAQWRRFSARAPVPIAAAAQTGEPVFLDSADAWQSRFGDRAVPAGASRSRSWAALPLVAEGRVLGALGLSFPREGPLSAEDRAFVTALAQQCGQAFERSRLFAAERAARAEAERANRAKSEFLAVMSHELRTPLNAIGGYAELLAMGIRGPVTEQQREDLERIQRSQRHLLGLINEVLNYAKLESGSVRYELAEVGVADAVAAARALVTPQVRARGLALAATIDESMIVRADRDKLQQILLNLLSNAAKFTDPGGQVEVSAAAAGERVEIRVRDTGVGIQAEKLEAIFEPFVQVDARLTRPHEGTGLGLAISRDLARGMGGDLRAESEVGVGSTFILTLPRAG